MRSSRVVVSFRALLILCGRRSALRCHGGARYGTEHTWQRARWGTASRCGVLGICHAPPGSNVRYHSHLRILRVAAVLVRSGHSNPDNVPTIAPSTAVGPLMARHPQLDTPVVVRSTGPASGPSRHPRPPAGSMACNCCSVE